MRISYLSVVGSYLLPSYLLIMLVFAVIPFRYYLAKVLNWTVGLSFTVNGVKVFIFPFAILASGFSAILHITELMSRQAGAKARPSIEDVKRLNQDYRNALVHVTHVIMGMLLFFCVHIYQKFEKEKAALKKTKDELRVQGVKVDFPSEVRGNQENPKYFMKIQYCGG